MQSQLEWGQKILYKVWNKKRRGENKEKSINWSRVFQAALKGGKNGILLNGILAIQCFCHAEDNVQ